MIELQSERIPIKVFFAIWPDLHVKTQLSRLTGNLEHLCGGYRTNSLKLHLTLVFLGNILTKQLAYVQEIASQIKLPCFSLTIDTIEYWKHNKIVYAGITDTPVELIKLVSQLHHDLQLAGFKLEQRSYIPHLTLIRNATCQQLPKLTTPIHWNIKEWMLIQSTPTKTGTVYSQLSSWKLIEK
ncbi:MAG: RNA 2',3'-cyclic phosphodiesterase [Nitrosomonas sp.]|nr:MAG: RNA 2',3'-cyclic phosphodiesterase [Nitrosomonas sp.]HMU63689.1 RNA 2',3'-cyclic phosphodiesterase [Nitrosomonas sp.]